MTPTLSLGSIFRDTFVDSKRYFWLYAKIASPSLLVAALLLAVSLYRVQANVDASLLTTLTSILTIGGSVVIALAQAYLSWLYLHNHIETTSKLSLGTVLVQEYTFLGSRAFWASIGASILAGLITFGGLILFILPGIWLAILLQFSELEALRTGEITASISRSKELVTGRWWFTFLASAVLSLVFGAIYMVAAEIVDQLLLLVAPSVGEVIADTTSTTGPLFGPFVVAPFVGMFSTVATYMLYRVLVATRPLSTESSTPRIPEGK